MRMQLLAVLAATLAVVAAAKNQTAHPHEQPFQKCVNQHHQCTEGHPAQHPQCQTTLKTCCEDADKQCTANPPKKAGRKKCNNWKKECNKGRHIGPKKNKEKCKGGNKKGGKAGGEKECHNHTKSHTHTHTQSYSQSDSAQSRYTPPPRNSGTPDMGLDGGSQGMGGEKRNDIRYPEYGGYAGAGGHGDQPRDEPVYPPRMPPHQV